MLNATVPIPKLTAQTTVDRLGDDITVILFSFRYTYQKKLIVTYFIPPRVLTPDGSVAVAGILTSLAIVRTRDPGCALSPAPYKTSSHPLQAMPPPPPPPLLALS